MESEIDTKAEMKSDVEFVRLDENTLKIPIYSSIPAGYPDFTDEEPIAYEYIPRALFPGVKFGVKCGGDSMSPIIEKGDICFIKPTKEPIDNKVMLVKTEKGFTIKRIKKDKNKIVLMSENQAEYKIEYKSLEIVGQVTNISKELK